MRPNTFFYEVFAMTRPMIALGCLTAFAAATSRAAVLPDGYEEEFHQDGKTYQSLGVQEDQYDAIEPVHDLYPAISPNVNFDESHPPLCKGSYEQVEAFFEEKGMTDGRPFVPPTKLKAEKFLGYSSYGYDDVVATVDGKAVKAYMVAANAIMAGCAPEHTPICIAFAEALGDAGYLDSLRSGKLTPMMYVNGPIARQIGIDCAQGMTTEGANVAIGRFMDLALLNLAGIVRTYAFGNVQPLVFAEDEEACVKIGWKPHQVEKGRDINDNTITATSFSMWGNSITPATSLPEEIMRVIAWDVTEKNLGGLGGASAEDNAGTRRLIFVTEPVATALATLYKTKADFESALVTNARRPLWMRAYAYSYASGDGSRPTSVASASVALRKMASEDVRMTVSPPWMNGITYANIDTVATMTKGHADIIIAGDSSRNKAQVMPGGVSVMKGIRLSNRWDSLVASRNCPPLEAFHLAERNHTISPPVSVPAVLSNGDYRILDPDTGESNMTRKGRIYFDASTSTLYYYAQNAASSSSVRLDPEKDSAFIGYLENLGINSSITVSSGKISAITIRFSSNDKKLCNSTMALTKDSYADMGLTVHANNTPNSNAAGGLAKDGATVVMPDSVTSFDVSIDGTVVAGESSNPDFLKLNGDRVTVDPAVEAGATAIIGSKNADSDTYRTMTFVNGGDGSYVITYNTANTLSFSSSAYYLEGAFNKWSEADCFAKTANPDIIVLTREFPEGTYEFKLCNHGTGKRLGNDECNISDVIYRSVLKTGGEGENAILNATGGRYEFKYEISANKLSVYPVASMSEEEPVVEVALTAGVGYEYVVSNLTDNAEIAPDEDGKYALPIGASVGIYCVAESDYVVVGPNPCVIEKVEPDTTIDPSKLPTAEVRLGTKGNPWLIGSPNAADVTAYTNGTTLVIEGTGAMSNFVNAANVPWATVAGKVKAVTVEEGVTLGSNALLGMLGTTTVNGTPLSFYDMVAGARGASGSSLPEGTIAVSKTELEAAGAATLTIVDGTAYVGVSVRTNGDITAEHKSWGRVKFDQDVKVGLSEDGTELVIPVPANAEQGFMVLESGTAN